LKRRLLCGVCAGLCAAVGLAAVLVNRNAVAVCTATNASGQRVVIGTELTARGERYKKDNPADDNNAIVESLGGRGPELAWTASSIARCRTTLNVSGALRAPMFGLALALAAGAIWMGGVRRGAAAGKHQVFLSYNHGDREEASRLHRLLTEHGIPVTMDSENMAPGDRIREFIERSIRESDVVVSLVSSKSPLSAWVAMETAQSLHRNQGVAGKRFIACYLDDAFFAPEWRLSCTAAIDDRLRRIEELLPEYAAKRIDTLDLNEEKTRLYELRNNLGVILSTLKGSLCLDLRGEQFEASGERLIAAIRNRQA
jgi:hypothetical protein